MSIGRLVQLDCSTVAALMATERHWQHECCVCLSAYAGTTARAAAAWTCVQHFVCVRCDEQLQRRKQECPLCRAPRLDGGERAGSPTGDSLRGLTHGDVAALVFGFAGPTATQAYGTSVFSLPPPADVLQNSPVSVSMYRASAEAAPPRARGRGDITQNSHEREERRVRGRRSRPGRPCVALISVQTALVPPTVFLACIRGLDTQQDAQTAPHA